MRVVFLLVFLTSCAQAPFKTDRTVLERWDEVCAIGRGIDTVSGNAWMRVQSPELKGQFPASIVARRDGDLDLEATNLVGGVEARVRIRDRILQVQEKNDAEFRVRAMDSWAGLPIRWASELFVGRIPCPLPTESGNRAEGDSARPEVFRVTDAEGGRFEYTMTKEDGVLWVKKLVWVHRSGQPALEVEFSSMEAETHSPLRWTLVSKRVDGSTSAELKVRWRERKLSTH